MSRKESHGERIIREFLERHNITYQQNYYIKTLPCNGTYNATGRLYIDFAIFRSPAALCVQDAEQRNALIVCALEYDGHTSHFENLRQMSRDRLKTNWCHTNLIPLRRLTCEPATQHQSRIETLVRHFLTHPYGAYREASSSRGEMGCPCTPRERYRKAQKRYDLDAHTTVPRPHFPSTFLISEIGEESCALTLQSDVRSSKERWAIVPYVSSRMPPWTVNSMQLLRRFWKWTSAGVSVVYKRFILYNE